MQRRLSVGTTTALIGSFLTAAGVRADWAGQTAAHLVEGDLRGYHQHGIGRIRQLADGLAKGTLRGTGRPVVATDRPGLVVLDAAGQLGVPAAWRAVELAAERAGQNGLAAVGLLNAGHLGILAPFAERLATPNRLAVVVSTTEPAAVAPGGSTRVVGTNPIAFACPCGDELLSADFATTRLTRGEVLNRIATGEPLPAGVAVDESGSPTVRPEDALAGGLLSFDGSTKGFLISVLLSLLAGPAIGGRANHEVRGTRWTDQPPSKGDLFLAIDLGADQLFSDQVQSFFAAAAADSSIRLPGRQARERRAETLRTGIAVSPEVWDLIGPFYRSGEV